MDMDAFLALAVQWWPLIKGLIVIGLSFAIGVTVVVLVIAGLPMVYHWRKVGSSDEQICYPFFIGLTDNICWLCYGYYKSDYGIVALNIYCTLMTIMYIAHLTYFRSNKRRMQLYIGTWLVCFIAWTFYMHMQPDDETCAERVGQLITILQTIGGLGLFYVFYLIIKTKRIDFLPYFPVALGFILQVLIVLLGAINSDLYLVAANIFFMFGNGLLLSAFYILPQEQQLVLPNVFVFIYERIAEAHHEITELRKKRNKKNVESSVDMNSNMLGV